MGKLQFIHTVRAPKHFSSGRSQYQSYISSNFTISSACALQAFICRTHSIWFSAFSCSVTPFCFASDRMISSMRFCAASSILSQYCLTYTQLYVRGVTLPIASPHRCESIVETEKKMTKGARREIVRCEQTDRTLLRDLPSQ